MSIRRFIHASNGCFMTEGRYPTDDDTMRTRAIYRMFLILHSARPDIASKLR
jgi:hypothetical protein